MLHQTCSLVAELQYTFLHTYLLKSVIMVSIIIFLLVVVANIHQGTSTPATVDVNKSPLDNAVDGLYKCLEGSTNHGKIPKERVDYWNKRHPLNFIVDTLMKELPRIFEEEVFKSLIRNQATVMIAALELCRPNVHGTTMKVSGLY
ncbi:uncharacterized protein LOC120352767 [Nilaparvata lugens]|uniref:uncharacterized protein LOC120352767 n=1 Tax=Nilaparvata lugens TaxID=108931 RepID=UPI00193CF730|nr:uncharacterized protein LOC120352767 [Nilaparvata lugens]